MEEIERRIIADRLERCHWNQTEGRGVLQDPALHLEPEDQTVECGSEEARPRLMLYLPG